MRRYFLFRLGSLALLCATFFGTILLLAAVTGCVSTHPHQHNSNKVTYENPNIKMRLTLHQKALNGVPSCQHSYSQVEVLNLHPRDSVTIESIQTTPEETFLTRFDPQKQQAMPGVPDKERDIFASASASSSTSWDQRSIPQQIHTSRIRSTAGFVLGPGETAILPVTYLPRYPCTLGTRDGSELEDYYAQQAPYQIAFSSTFDPDDENFSLAQPPPPKLTKLISGTARADWEQLVRDMPPQERGNWLQQQQQQQQQRHELPIELPDAYQGIRSPTSTTTGDFTPLGVSSSTEEEWIFQVTTTILIQTSRGPIQIPVQASSRRQNSYGLPDVIYFDQEEDGDIDNSYAARSRDSSSKGSASPQPSKTTKASEKTPGVLWFDTDMAPAASSTGTDSNDTEQQEQHPNDDGDDEISHMTSRDCYNLFMTNSNTTNNMRVVDVYLSRPDLMSLQVQGQLRAPSSSVRQWWNTAPRRQEGDVDVDDYAEADQLGPLLIGPGEQRYVVTVCTAGNSPPPTPSDGDDWLYGKEKDSADSFDEPFVTADDDASTIAARAANAALRAARSAASAQYSLGFIHIQTETGKTFFVALERLRKQCRSGPSSATSSGRRDRRSQSSPQSAPSVATDQQYKLQAYPPSYHNALYQVQMQPLGGLAAKIGKPSSLPAPTSPLVTSALKSVPPRLDFSLLSSSSPIITSFIGIENPKDYPIKIMRSGVAVEIEDELDSSQPNPEDLGLHMSVKIQNAHLEPNGVTEKALMITCSIRWDKFQAHSLESLFFHGNAILRATAHVDFNYNQWIRNLVNTNSKLQQGKILITNDYANEPAEPGGNAKQTEFVLEIPLSVSMVQGKIGIMIHRTSHPFPHLWAVQSWKEGLGSISSIFFPHRAFDIRAELDSGEGPISEPIFGRGGIDHKLRIFANINIPSRVGNRDDSYQPQALRLAAAVIEEEKGSDEMRDQNDGEDICGRFHVTISPPPSDPFPFDGFNDVGVLHIQYRFPSSKRSDSDEDQDDKQIQDASPAYPKYCHLSFTTDPFTERHKIPLIVYPGETEITATQSPQRSNKNRGKYKKKNKKKGDSQGKSTDWDANVDETSAFSHAVVGFDNLLIWFNTSRIGWSLKSYLEQAGGEHRDWGWTKRGSEDDETILGKYVSSLCQKSRNLRKAHLRPILLKVGAIRHGSMETSSFYMTNHNPIPLLVSIDVGEVEGMSISLARVPTRGQGDGHNILDHFPKKRATVTTVIGSPPQHLVRDGEYRGHPLEGLRKFLKTSDIAQQFLSLFRFRDAISLSQSAVYQQPLLGTLYKKYAFGEFHRDPLPIRFGRDGWSRCRHSKHSRKSSHMSEHDYDNNLTDTTVSGENSEEYGNYDEEHIAQAIRSGSGPYMISDDFKQPRPLKVCWDKDAEPLEYPSDGTFTIVPPGAVARFDVKLHAPPKAMLRDDITRFLSTGLVLSTDHGEILPIFATFEALLGELKIARVRESPEGGQIEKSDRSYPHSKMPSDWSPNVTIMEVPANLFYESSEMLNFQTADSSPRISRFGVPGNQEHSVPLRVASSFSRDVSLVSVSSCNPWFQIRLKGNDGELPRLPKHNQAGAELGVDIGVLMSTISCKTERNSIASLDYPSFYQCVLNWLSNRSELQPRGCGVSSSDSLRSGGSDDSSLVFVAEHAGVKRAMKAFEKSLLVSSFAFGGSSQSGNKISSHQALDLGTKATKHSTGDGDVAPIVIDVFAEAWDSWRVVADYGLRKLSSTLKATIEYVSAGGLEGKLVEVQNLSVSMRDTVVESMLTAPKLFDSQRANESENIAFAALGDDDVPSILEFHSTLVADSSSLTIPVRNPTAVPIRVRLSTAYPEEDQTGVEKGTLRSKFSVDQDVRISFTGSDSPPFVQRKKLNTTTQYFHVGVMADEMWWDGAGGYFLADDYGDIIRSQHNIRIMSAAGAHVGLVNPSLHANVAVLVGCGVRCGVREEKTSPFMLDANASLKLTSPVGASAAAGTTLSGRTRSNIPQMNLRRMEEALFSAGAASSGKRGGPAAFALPFSALDEIIIPPFGEVELGPVMFRPPGRYSVHGCQAASDSKAIPMSGTGEVSKACRSNMYQSMVYLENSLTGLERILLKGRALWERVVFLDPPPVDKRLGDDFGNVEFRHGRSALMFSGSRASGITTLQQQQHTPLPTVPGSVIQEVLVHNQGDTLVEFDGVYLSDSARLHTKYSTSSKIGRLEDECSYRQFRLLNCLDEESRQGNVIIQSVRNGFSLKPGESVSLFVEHFPDCSQPRDFIALNLERRRKSKTSIPGKTNQGLRGRDQNHSFRHRKLELLIGYDMTDEEHRTCSPIQRWGYSMSHLHHEARCMAEKRCRDDWLFRFNHRVLWYVWAVLGFVTTATILAGIYATLYSCYLYRRQSSDFFCSALAVRTDGGIANNTAAHTGRGNWSVAFRCLAHVDPTSSDLQSLGREQIRHVLLGRYRSIGILSPQCLTSNGVFNRERGGVASCGSPTRQISGKEGNAASNDRVRTLSDAIFKHYMAHNDCHLQTSLPFGLAWRTAVSRGIVLPCISEDSSVNLMTSELLLRRAGGEGNEESSGDEQSNESSSQHQRAHGNHTSDESEQSDDLSEAQFTEVGDDANSQLQESSVSELSEEPPPSVEQPPGSTCDASAIVPTLDEAAPLEEGLEANQVQSSEGDSEANSEPPDESTDFEEIQPQTSSNASGMDGQPGEEKIAGATNGANNVVKHSVLVSGGTDEHKMDGTKVEREEERSSSSQPQKRKDKSQEARRDRRSRQKARGSSPPQIASIESPAATSPQPKPSQGRENKSKTTEQIAHPRPPKGKANVEKGRANAEKVKVSTEKVRGSVEKGSKASTEKGKQSGKANQLRDREKRSDTSTSDPNKVPKVDDKGSKRRGNKGEAPGGVKKNTKDTNGKIVPNAKKPRNASTKKGNKSVKGASTTQARIPDQDSQGDLVTKLTVPGEETPARPLVLRPPPGLAPPPGFDQGSGTPQRSSISRASFYSPLLPPSAFTSDAVLLGSPSSAVLGTHSQVLGESAFGGLSPTLLTLTGDATHLSGLDTPLRRTSSLRSSSHGHASDALLASVATASLDRNMQWTQNTGFDVMDFLDSILNDGNVTPADASPRPGQGTFLGGTTPVQTLLSTPVPPLSSDPWATERQSRASAYGINIDDAEALSKALPSPNLLSLNEGSVEGISSIPLLNTASILYEGERMDDDEEDEDDDNGNSFYAGLLFGMSAEDDVNKRLY